MSAEPRPAGASDTHWAELRALFDEVVELPEGERRAALEKACATRPARIEEVLALVRAAESGDEFLVPPARAPRARVGRFELEGVLGRGRLGTVHRARAVDDGTVVTLRVVPLAERAHESLARLRELAPALEGLVHPALARTLETGVCVVPGSEASALYFACELVSGSRPLVDAVRDARRPEACVAHFPEICDALALAHARGLLHGGLSAANVRVDADERARVLDLGVGAVFPEPDAPPSEPGDRVAVARLLALALADLAPGSERWREPAHALARQAAQPDAGGELNSVAGLGAALRRTLATGATPRA